MSYQIVVDNEWATVRYNPEDQYIYHTFNKPIHGQPFRDVMNAGLDALVQNKAKKWLSDDRKNAQFPEESVVFALTDWGPRAAKGGWRFWALVVPQEVAGRAGMQDIVAAYYEMGVRVMVFTEVEPAREWLLMQK